MAPLRAVAGAVLLAAAAAACSGSSPDQSPPSFEAQFDAVWADFDATYPYFVLKGVDWTAARETYRPRAAAARSEAELAGVLAEMLGTLRDVHVALLDPDGSLVPTWWPSFEPNFDRTVWSGYAARWGFERHGNWGFGWIGAVPYVAVDAWSQPLAGLDAALESFRGAPGLVVDLRINGGGSTQYAFPLLERIFDQTRIVAHIRYRNGPGHDDFTPFQPAAMSPGGAWQFTRPVLLLVGPASMSTSEDFTSGARELPHVTVVGATTGGASANPAERALSDGWRYRISRWYYTTADGIVVEGNGIPPHVAVPATRADFAAGVDPVLDYVERWAAAPEVRRGP